MDLTDLAQRFSAELARTFDLPQDRKVVTLEDDGEGGIAVARVDLSGARFDLEGAMSMERGDGRAPDVIAQRLEVSARPLTVEGVGLWLEGHAEGVGMATEDGPPRLVSLKHGRVKGQLDRRELDAAIRAIAQQMGTRYGVQVEDIDLDLANPTPRTLDVRARVRAAKRVLVANVRTTVDGSARLEAIPGEGIALVDVTYGGEGPLAPVVRSLLASRLDRLKGKILPLPVFPGRIVDAHFELGDAIRVEAELAG